MKQQPRIYWKILLVLILIVQQSFAQNSVLINFGANTCSSSSAAGFSMITNPLSGNPTMLANCPLTAQLPDFYNVFIAYNPKDNKMYIGDVRDGLQTKIWILDIGLPGDISCPPVIPVTPTYSYNYVSNNFEFDNFGDLWSLSDYSPVTGTCNMDKFDVNTGIVLNTRTLQFPTGLAPTSINSGDLTILPNGRMFATLGSNPSRLYEVLNYSSTVTNATAVFLTELPKNCYGIAYLNGQLEITGSDFGSSCYYFDYDITTNTLGSLKTFQNGQSPIDNTSFTPAIGTTKQLVNAVKVNANTADLTYEIFVRNMGNVILKDINVTDNLASVFGAANVSNISVSFVPGFNVANLALNPVYNGQSITSLLFPSQNLPNQTSALNDYYFKLQLRCRVTNLNSVTTYLNSAVGKAVIGSTATASLINVSDSSNNGSQLVIDPNNNGNPGEIGENIPTPFVFGLIPVRFISVSANLSANNSAVINWLVATPTVNADKFEVQYSSNGIDWQTLGSLPIPNVNQGRYQFSHENLPAGILYYRIRQTDNDGSFVYSRVVMLNNKKGSVQFSINPNPANHYISVSAPRLTTGKTTIELYDAVGRKLLSQPLTETNTEINTSNFASGTYVLRILQDGDVNCFKVVVKH